MAGKIGVYFDQSNIGGGLDAEALAQDLRDKWGELAATVKVVPVLAEAVDEIRADIAAQGLDGVLLCGASPRVDADLYRFAPNGDTPVQVEHVNLREQCVLAYRDPDGASVEGLAPGEAPELLRLMATDYVNMGMVRLQKTETPEPAVVAGVRRILVIGGGWTGMRAAMESAATGYEVVLVEKTDKLGGAASNIPMTSPLSSPWTDKEPLNLADHIARLEAEPAITLHLQSTVTKLEGQPGEFTAELATPSGTVTVQVGAVVLATGWTPLDGKYLEPMGYGSPSIIHAGQFAKMHGSAHCLCARHHPGRKGLWRACPGGQGR